ncbi:hypothetical protein CR513_18601, partial [Mucuna pruriens]
LGTKKPKVARGDRLVYQRTLVDLILSVLASGSEPSPFFHGDCCRRRSHQIRTLLRKARNVVVSGSSNSVSSSDNSSSVTNTSNLVAYDSTNTFTELEQMENNDRTLKELATPDVVRRPLQAFEGIPCDLLHNEATRDTGG